MNIDCIAIPTTKSELGDLSTLFACWKLFHRQDQIAERLLISIPGPEDGVTYSSIERLTRIFEAQQLFQRIEVRFLNIPPEEDIYIRHGQKWEGNLPRLGLKSGPNSQFFKTLHHARDSQYTFLNETDVFPLHASWHKNLSAALRPKQDWVVGSHYRGETILGPDILSHINGAAIYATGNQCFQNFCDEFWEPGVEEMCKEQPDTAYDIWLSRLQHKFSVMPDSWTERDRSYQLLFTDALSRFSVTDQIANLTLSTDFKSIDELKSNGFSVVHGKHFRLHALTNAIKYAREEHGFTLSRIQSLAILSRNENNANLADVLIGESAPTIKNIATRKRARKDCVHKADKIKTADASVSLRDQDEEEERELINGPRLAIQLFPRLSDICIFTRSYIGDKTLLPSLYSSLEKHFADAAEAVLVVEIKDYEEIKEFAPEWVRIETEESFAHGTIQHKYTKLTADNYTSKDWIFHIDSDTVATGPITSSYLLEDGKPILEIASYESLRKHQNSDSFIDYMKEYVKQNHLPSEIEKELEKIGVIDRVNWFNENFDDWIRDNFEDWFDDWFPRWKYAFGLDVWQEGTSFAFGSQINFEFSQKPIKLYPREIYPVCREHIKLIHKKDLRDFISTRVGKQTIGTNRRDYFSDLNFIGACLYYYAQTYIHWVRTDIGGFDYRETLFDQKISYDIHMKQNADLRSQRLAATQVLNIADKKHG